MFKKTNGKRRWRRICKLDGYCRKDIKFYSEYDRERQKEWLKDNCGQWHGNAYWKQHCIPHISLVVQSRKCRCENGREYHD